MYINFQQNQVKTQVMTVPTRYQITAKEIIDTDGRHDGQTNVHGRTDKRTCTDERTDGRTDGQTSRVTNIRYFFQKRKKY